MPTTGRSPRSTERSSPSPFSSGMRTSSHVTRSSSRTSPICTRPSFTGSSGSPIVIGGHGSQTGGMSNCVSSRSTRLTPIERRALTASTRSKSAIRTGGGIRCTTPTSSASMGTSQSRIPMRRWSCPRRTVQSSTGRSRSSSRSSSTRSKRRVSRLLEAPLWFRRTMGVRFSRRPTGRALAFSGSPALIYSSRMHTSVSLTSLPACGTRDGTLHRAGNSIPMSPGTIELRHLRTIPRADPAPSGIVPTHSPGGPTIASSIRTLRW